MNDNFLDNLLASLKEVVVIKYQETKTSSLTKLKDLIFNGLYKVQKSF